MAEASVTLNAPDYDPVLNPNDHPDHLAAGDAGRAALGTHAWPQAWYVDYDTPNRPVNLPDSAYALKHLEFIAYDSQIVAAGYESYANSIDYNSWQQRTYYCTVGAVAPPPPPTISLSASGHKVKGVEYVDLTWSGASGSYVDLWRNGVIVSRPANNASGTTAYSDNTSAKGGHTFTYKVCLTGSTTCSSNATVTF